MAKTNVGSFFNKFLSLFILLLHLGCFIFTAKVHQKPAKKRKPSRLSASSDPYSHKPHKVLSSTWSSLKRIFSSYKANCKNTIQTHPTTTATTLVLASARNSQQSLISMNIPPGTLLSDSPPPRHQKQSDSCPESDISTDNPFFPLRNAIFPCTACGEIFPKPNFLEQHQATKHAVSELIDGDSGKNIVGIIFKTGWTDRVKNPEIHRILKIHNSTKILERFEEYRELVKAKAARNGAAGKRDERCIADGNELLRFYCSTFMCDLGLNGISSICNQQYCSICGIIKSGFSPKMDGISTLSTSWRAHLAIPEYVEEEFKFMNVKRAMLVCRVVAGRVGSEGEEIDKVDGGFDSVIVKGEGSGVQKKVDEEELLVFNPRAVLPCFVIVYTV